MSHPAFLNDPTRRFVHDNGSLEAVAAGGTLSSPIFYVGHAPYNPPAGIPLGARRVVQVASPLVSFFINTTGAVIGSTFALLGDNTAAFTTAQTIVTLSVAAGGTFTERSLNAALSALRMPTTYWRALFTNGGGAATTCRFIVAGGGL